MKHLALVTVVFCLNVFADGFPSSPTLPTEEHLLGVKRVEGGLEFQVQSGGCTERDDFYFNIEKENMGNDLYLIQMIRKTPDSCEAYVPKGVVIFVPFSELNIPDGSSYQIINPLMGRT